MTKKNEKHLDFDLDFLESVKTKKPMPEEKKVEESSSATADSDNSSSNTGSTIKHTESVDNYNARRNNRSCIIWALVIGVVIALFVWLGSSDSGTQTTSTSACDTAKIDSLKPPESEKANVNNLEQRANTTYVNHYSQQSVDSYNSLVNQYNTARNSYNAKVDTYNNYLTTNNCK
jgi:hypothetical protein